MADIFCDFASGNDADDGSTRALAKKTLAAALTAAGAGGRVGVKNDHAESQASAMTLASPGTTASPTQILCIDWSSDTFGSNAVTTGATVATTGANNLTCTGFAYVYGIALTAGSSTSAADLTILAGANGQWVLENCGLTLGGNNANSDFLFGNGSGTVAESVILRNCTLTFVHTSNRCLIRCNFEMYGGSIAGTIPTTVFHSSAINGIGVVTFSGVDLSAAASGKTLVNVSGGGRILWYFFNNKLGSSVTITGGSVASRDGTKVLLVNSDSADTNYRYYYEDCNGTITHESTIVRSGGASDGTTSISRKLSSSANVNLWSPLCLYEVVFWNETLSALSLAAEVVSDGVTFTDAELWMEVEALTNSGFPYSSLTSDRAANILSTPANQASSSETWTTTGLASPTKQKLEVSVTPAEKGWIRCRIYLAKASSTVYVCPLITGLGFTSGRQWQAAEGYVLEGASSSVGGGSAYIIGG